MTLGGVFLVPAEVSVAAAEMLAPAVDVLIPASRVTCDFDSSSLSDRGIIPISRHCLNKSVSLKSAGCFASAASARMAKTWRHPAQQK